ncbi:MAG: hypothetical protein ACOCXG_04495 [Nanoarchaeota archaeon]
MSMFDILGFFIVNFWAVVGLVLFGVAIYFVMARKVQKTIIKIGLWIFICVMFIVGCAWGIAYTSEAIDRYQTKIKIKDIQESYYEKLSDGEISAVDEGLKSYYSLSDEELADLTKVQKSQLAKKEAINLGVWDLKLNIVADLDGTLQCVNLESFEYDDYFSAFRFNPKWEEFFKTYSIFDGFNSGSYKYEYFSNVYVEGTEFRLNYKEDSAPKVVYYEDKFLDTEDFVVFNDRVQVVLSMTELGSEIPKDYTLDYEVTLESFEDGKELKSFIYNIPLVIENGELKVVQDNCGFMENIAIGVVN